MLVGPQIGLSNPKIYGSGEGGYTRNMRVYLDNFNSKNLQLVPCYLTLRGQFNLGYLNFFVRAVVDVFRFCKVIHEHRIDQVHFLAQYRKAVYREILLIFLAKIFGKKVTYEVKAGSFKASFSNGTFFYQYLIRIIISLSDKILTEGKRDIPFIQSQFGKRANYFPNIVPQKEFKEVCLLGLAPSRLRLLFVGFAYAGKGVYELLECFEQLKSNGAKITLTFIGGMDNEFTDRVLNSVNRNDITIHGKLNHQEVLEEMLHHDIYMYPSIHEGEGHNNSINEALMSGLSICSTRNGFLNEFLNDDNSYEIKTVSSNSIIDAITIIMQDIELAKARAKKGKELILEQFNSEKAKLKLHKFYNLKCSN
jgi:glycosyltransferase involved in cell wall biosynthesis